MALQYQVYFVAHVVTTLISGGRTVVTPSYAKVAGRTWAAFACPTRIRRTLNIRVIVGIAPSTTFLDKRIQVAIALFVMASVRKNGALRRQQRPLWGSSRNISVAQGALNVLTPLDEGITPRGVQVQKVFPHMCGDVKYISLEVKDEMDWPSTGGSKTRSESGDGGIPSVRSCKRFGQV